MDYVFLLIVHVVANFCINVWLWGYKPVPFTGLQKLYVATQLIFWPLTFLAFMLSGYQATNLQLGLIALYNLLIVSIALVAKQSVATTAVSILMVFGKPLTGKAAAYEAVKLLVLYDLIFGLIYTYIAFGPK